MMDEARDEKLLSRTRDDFSRTPMVQKPDRSITISKRGLSEIIFRAVALDCAREIYTAQKVAGTSLRLGGGKNARDLAIFSFAVYF